MTPRDKIALHNVASAVHKFTSDFENMSSPPPPPPTMSKSEFGSLVGGGAGTSRELFEYVFGGRGFIWMVAIVFLLLLPRLYEAVVYRSGPPREYLRDEDGRHMTHIVNPEIGPNDDLVYEIHARPRPDCTPANGGTSEIRFFVIEKRADGEFLHYAAEGGRSVLGEGRTVNQRRVKMPSSLDGVCGPLEFQWLGEYYCGRSSPQNYPQLQFGPRMSFKKVCPKPGSGVPHPVPSPVRQSS